MSRREEISRAIARMKAGQTYVPQLPAHEELPALPERGVYLSPARRLRHRDVAKGIFRIRESVHPAIRLVLSVLPFAAVAAWWFWMTAGGEPEFRHIAPTILPSPAEFGDQVGTLITVGRLGFNIALSLTRVMAGFSIAAAIALPLGVLMGASGRINATFNMTMTVLSYLPVPAVVPLTMAWWGSGEQQKVGFLALVTFAVLLAAVYRSITRVDHKYVLSSYTQGASAWDIVSKVLVPVAMPDIFAAMRTCLGVGWTYIVLVEVIKSGDEVGGVGNLIMVYHRLGHMPEVYLTVISIMLVGAVIDRLCMIIGSMLFPYKNGQHENGN